MDAIITKFNEKDGKFLEQFKKAILKEAANNISTYPDALASKFSKSKLVEMMEAAKVKTKVKTKVKVVKTKVKTAKVDYDYDDDDDEEEAGLGDFMYDEMFTYFCNRLVGRMGGIKFDSRIKGHNFFLEEEYSKEVLDKYNDIFIIGVEGKKIDQDDVDKFHKKLSKYVDDKIWLNGRSYFFEGIEKKGKGYCIAWGS